MTATIDSLPITEVVHPSTAAEVCAHIRQAGVDDTAVYPIGGGTSLDFGLPAVRPGVGLSLKQMDQVIDYPARDLTVTVQAGTTVRSLANVLAQENQRLPIDVPQDEEATVGGVVATNFSGPRCYGHGTIRDFVIGIRAVDGRGTQFKGGGRVVKNVAGYDFCRLLTGSLGTLGVITELTFKLKPIPEQSCLIAIRVDDLDRAEELLGALVQSETTPTAVELLSGPEFADGPLATVGDSSQSWLVVGFEGTATEVQWMADRLTDEWREQGASVDGLWSGEAAEPLWDDLSGFPARGDSPLVLKINVVPSATTQLIRAARAIDADVSIQAHAGNGALIAKFSEFPAAGLSQSLSGALEPAATAAQGNVVILRNPAGTEMTRQSMWGGIGVPYWLMTQVKREFDPQDILNPGRFVYQ